MDLSQTRERQLRATDGAEAHLLLAGDQGIPHAVLQNNRGWTDDEWRRGIDRLALPADPSHIDALTDIATEISSSGVIPFPNPMV